MNTLPNILPETEAIRVGGITGLKGIADELNRREILTANGGGGMRRRLPTCCGGQTTSRDKSIILTGRAAWGSGRKAGRISVSGLALSSDLQKAISSRCAEYSGVRGSAVALGYSCPSLASLSPQAWRSIGGCTGKSASNGTGWPRSRSPRRSWQASCGSLPGSSARPSLTGTRGAPLVAPASVPQRPHLLTAQRMHRRTPFFSRATCNSPRPKST